MELSKKTERSSPETLDAPFWWCANVVIFEKALVCEFLNMQLFS